MEEKIYTQLLDLIKVLNPDEIRIVKQYLIAFERKDRKFEPVILLLFKYINHNRSDCATTYKKFQKNNNIKGFRMLCYRLRNKILESFLLDVNINRENYTSKMGKLDVQTHKILMQTKMCFSKGKSEIALFLLNKVISLGKKHELYPVLIEALHLKRRAHGLRYASVKYKRITKEIEFYQHCQSAIFTAVECQNHMQSEAAFSHSVSKKVKAFLYYINKIKKLYVKYPSPTLNYHLLWLQMTFHQYNSRYKKSDVYCEDLLDLIIKHEYLYTRSLHASIIANKAYNAVFLKQFSVAYEYIAAAEQYFFKGSFNYVELQAIKFLAYYFSNSNKEAIALANYLQTSNYRKTEFQQSMWNYYLAVCYFNEGKYKEAQVLLNQVQELKRDKVGWNFSVRILNICCSVELNKLILADKQIDTLRFYYYKKQGLGARNNAIVKSILFLEDDYNYTKVYKKVSHEIKCLQSNKGWYKWDANRTPELFFFDSWFLSKLKNTSYRWQVLKNY